MRMYYLRRPYATKLTSPGVVAQMIEFDDGTCVTRWLGAYKSTTEWPDFDTARTIHTSDGKTELIEVKLVPV